MQANLLCQAALLAGAKWVLKGETGLLLFALAAGFNYGGVLVLYVSSAARNWGSERVGQVYALLFSANIPAALAPIAAGYGFDILGSFTLPLFVIGVLLLLASLMVGRHSEILDLRGA